MMREHHAVFEETVWKWRRPDRVHDRSHTSHMLPTKQRQTQTQEAVAVALCRTLPLPLKGPIVVVREFLNADRCWPSLASARGPMSMTVSSERSHVRSGGTSRGDYLICMCGMRAQ